MRKSFAKFVSVVLAGILLTGCSGGSGNSATQPAADGGNAPQTTTVKTSEDEKVTLRFAWWGGDERTAATLDVIEQFEALHQNVTIEGEYGGSDGYHDKLSTQLAAGTAADIVQIDPETFPTYIDGGDYFINYMDYNFDLSKFEEAYISLPINGRYDGRQLGLPSGIAGPMLLVNQGLADEVGIDFTQEYTWEDLINWGRQVREYDDSMYLLCTNKDYVTNLVVYIYAKQLTGQTIFDKENNAMNLTEAQLKEVFELVERLYQEEVVAPASYSAAYAGDNLQSDPNWIGGKYVATFSYISTMDVMMAANPDSTYSAGNLPVMDNARDKGWTANCPQVFAVTRTCKYPDVAVAFMEYFFNNETAMETLACTRSVPPTAKAREICEANGSLSEISMEAANIASSMGGITPDSIASSQEGKQIMVDAVEKIGYGAATPESAAADTMGLLQGLLE